jgi:hypothetical protein
VPRGIDHHRFFVIDSPISTHIAGAIAATGAPVVGWLAERMGFSTKGSPGEDLDSARALGDAMLLCTAIPWALCALFYTG